MTINPNGQVVSPITGRPGIIVAYTPFGPAIQDMQEWRGKVVVSYQSVTLQCSFRRCDGRGPLLSPADGAVSLPSSLAQHLVQIGAAVPG